MLGRWVARTALAGESPIGTNRKKFGKIEESVFLVEHERV